MLEDLARALSAAGHEHAAKLVGPDGNEYPLPTGTFDALLDVVKAMARGQAITVAPRDTVLTTQEAADLLGISRPTFVKLLERGEVPFEKPNRHRKVLLTDVLEYKARARQKRRRALDELTAVSDELGLYDDQPRGS